MARLTADRKTITAETVTELVTRIIVLCVCGTLCFFGAADTLRALEHADPTLNDALLSVGTVVLAIVFVRSVIRLLVLTRLVFRDYFAEQIELHRTDPSILNSVLSRPCSQLNWPLMILMIGLITGMIVAMFKVAMMRGESTSNTVQVCMAVGITMLPLPWALVLWSSGRQMWAIILTAGAVAVSLFWTGVTTLVTFDQLNFGNANPVELALVSLGILCGAMLLASSLLIARIHVLLTRRLQVPPGAHVSVDRSF